MISRFSFIIVILCSIALLLILSFQPAPKRVQAIAVEQNYSLKKVTQAIEFKETSLHWKVVPAHQQTSQYLTSLTETLGSGVCALDFNNDGWIDLFFIGGSGHTRYYGRKAWWHKEGGNRLLVNIKGQHFKDVTQQAGLQKRMWGMGCASADLDNNGLTDIIITGVNGNYIYANQGDGSFVDVTKNSGIFDDHWSTGASLADFNNDGLLDIYISNYILYKKDARTFERNRGFRLTGNVAFDATLYDPEPNRLYLNKGNFKFKDITQTAGVSNSLGRSLGAKWFDLNNDNWLDLIVINDKNSPNQVFINQHNNSFSRGETSFAPLEISGVHDLIINDFDNNNQHEFFMSRSMSHPPAHISKITNSAEATKNNLTNTYLDIAWSRNLAQAKLLPYTAWAAISNDFNNDGFLDIYVANGMATPDIDSHYVSQAQQNSLFINKGNGDFHYQAATANQQSSYSSRGAIAVDLNNDGSLEVIVSNNNDVWQIFENHSKNNNRWLGIDLLTKNNAADIYGAKIKLTTDKLTINRTIQAKQSFLSQGDPRLHIGLGDSEKVKELIIYWRDGKQSSFKNLMANQYITISKADNTVQPKKYNIDKIDPVALSISQLDEQALMNLTKVLIQVDPAKIAKQLYLVWQYGSNSTKQFILLHIKNHWHNDYLVMVKEALNLKELDLRLLAIEILKNAELESSVVWLIDQLNDSNPQVQCAIADTFRLFFDEEEAVTHRKKLALSPLINMLMSDSVQVKICIAQALAAAENKRAILPLLGLTSKNEPEQVRNAAIRALGLIRDASAKETLIKLVKDKESLPSVVASALIALSRLNEPSLLTLFEQAISPTEGKPLAQVKNYNILFYLLTPPDGIVFPRKQIEQQLVKLNKGALDGNPSHLQQDVPTYALKAIEALKVIEAGKLTNQIQIVKTYLNDKNPQIKIQAIKTMSVFKIPKTRQAFESSLLTLPLDTTLAIIYELEKSDLWFSEHFISSLIQQINKQDNAFEKLIKLFSFLPDSSTKLLFNNLISQELTDKQYLKLLDGCSNKNLTYIIESKEIFKSASISIQKAYVNCLFPETSSLPIHSKSNNNQLNKRLVLKSMLLALANNQDAKNTFIMKAAKSDAVIAKTMLSKAIDSLTSSQLEEAFNILGTHKLTSDKRNLLWELLRNSQQNNGLRLLAASHLVALDETQVLNYLNKHILHNETY